jgi:hypothetical protein
MTWTVLFERNAMKSRLAVSALVAIVACGCGTTAAERSAKAKSSLADCQRRTQSWIGKAEVELLQSLGAPARTSSDGKDGKILEYHADVDLGKKESVGAFSGSWTQYTLTIKTDFFVNDKGQVYLANCLEGQTQTKTSD